jgi:hypothetical protein
MRLLRRQKTTQPQPVVIVRGGMRGALRKPTRKQRKGKS